MLSSLVNGRLVSDGHIYKCFVRSYVSILAGPVEHDHDSVPTVVSDSDEEVDKGPKESNRLR